MVNRLFNPLIARFAALAALLALALVLAAPVAFAQDSSIDYPENGDGPGGDLLAPWTRTVTRSSGLWRRRTTTSCSPSLVECWLSRSLPTTRIRTRR